MSDGETLPRSEIALEALMEIRALLDEREGSDWMDSHSVQQIDHILHMTYARLRMADMTRSGRDATWLAKVNSSTWPRRFEQRGKTNVAICFNAVITDGAKVARDKEVEVRMPLDEAISLGRSLAGWAQRSDGTPRTEESLAELLPGGSEKKGDET